MKRSVRAAISIFTFASVAILGIADRAPYVGVEEASAEQSKACLQGCKKSAVKDCGGEKQCWNSCVCNQPAVQKVCSTRAPCNQGSRCVNGLCAVACGSDDDCASAGGGVCRTGFCGRRTNNELASCQTACKACGVKMQKCRADTERCISKC